MFVYTLSNYQIIINAGSSNSSQTPRDLTKVIISLTEAFPINSRCSGSSSAPPCSLSFPLVDETDSYSSSKLSKSSSDIFGDS